MLEPGQKLVRVPPPELAETPASWISRLALSQGVTPGRMLAYLGVAQAQDIDIQFACSDLKNVAMICGFSLERFSIVQRMFQALAQVDSSGDIYLLSLHGEPTYRFCRACLHAQKNKYFPIHWRFKAWHWCPLHNALLDDACAHCDSPVILPGAMINAGFDRQGIGSLGYCLQCAKNLTVGNAVSRNNLRFCNLTEAERQLLNNGRALLAALYKGYFMMPGTSRSLPLSGLVSVHESGTFLDEEFRPRSLNLGPQRAKSSQ